MGKAPDFVLEIGSPSTGRNDVGEKRDVYASMGVGEYWLFDPSGGDHYGFALRGERLVDGEYRLLEMVQGEDGSVWGLSPVLNLEFHWVDGSLRVYDPVGRRWLKTPVEEREAREAAEFDLSVAEVRVESAEAERAAEAARAAEAEARVAELEAALRRMSGSE